MRLRLYQQDAVDDLRQSFGSGRRAPLLVLPTGGGKTFVFCYIAANAAERGNRTLILVHRQELLRQTSDSLTQIGVRHGLIAPQASPRFGELVQVASVQTVVRRFHQFEQAGWTPDLVVPDEAHHATAGTWRKVIDRWPSSRILGVTATPCRMDGRGLDDVFDDLVEGPQIGDLVDEGHLSPPAVYAPPIKADLTGVRTRAGDYAKNELADRMDKPTVTGDAVEHYGRICPGTPAIAFCVSVAHAEHVAEQFCAAGWQAESLDGSMSDDQRKRRIADLGAGRLHVLTSCDIISEGTDIPIVGAAILLRPTKSLGLYLQQVGRALRPYDGKDEAVILDHVGNVQTHGLPDEPREWTLAGRAKGKRAANDNAPPPPVTCEGCFRQIRRPAPPTCPHCGRQMSAKDRMASLQQQDGELQRLTPQDRKTIAANRRQEQAMARSLQELVALGQQRGYKNPQKWAWKVYTSRRGK